MFDFVCRECAEEFDTEYDHENVIGGSVFYPRPPKCPGCGSTDATEIPDTDPWEEALALAGAS